MKKLGLLIIVALVAASCGSVKHMFAPREDGLVMTRKYIGTFIEYRSTPPARFGDPNLIWIKTSMEGTYGRISAYSRDCEFKPGESVYIRKVFIMPGGVSGYWSYQVESEDEKTVYRLTEFQNDKKVLVETWF